MDDTPRVVFNTVSVSSGAFVRELNLLDKLPVDGIEYEVLCSAAMIDKLDNVGENVHLNEVTTIENSLERPAGTVRRLLWDNISLPRHIRRLDGDLLYFPLQITNLVDITPKVVAVRNAAPFYPERQPDRPLTETLRLSVLRRATKRSIRQARRVVFFTQTTLERVAAEFPAVREKGVVIPHGVPSRFSSKEADPSTLRTYNLPKSFLLSVSNVARYKNQCELLEGYAAANKRIEMPPLCLAGKTVDEDYAREVAIRIDELGISHKVRRLGFVAHDDLPDLHAASTGFVFSSACENAPITLIEALACGTPIACSNATSMPEICGDAAIYFDPDSPADIADTLVQFVTDDETRDRLGKAALERADRYSWERAARETHELFTTVLAGDGTNSRVVTADSGRGVSHQ
jgi:glycosyltransferase involved in cell wall biosynthesis